VTNRFAKLNDGEKQRGRVEAVTVVKGKVGRRDWGRLAQFLVAFILTRH
jgi:hypothetical protein